MCQSWAWSALGDGRVSVKPRIGRFRDESGRTRWPRQSMLGTGRLSVGASRGRYPGSFQDDIRPNRLVHPMDHPGVARELPYPSPSLLLMEVHHPLGVNILAGDSTEPLHDTITLRHQPSRGGTRVTTRGCRQSPRGRNMPLSPFLGSLWGTFLVASRGDFLTKPRDLKRLNRAADLVVVLVDGL